MILPKKKFTLNVPGSDASSKPPIDTVVEDTTNNTEPVVVLEDVMPTFTTSAFSMVQIQGQWSVVEIKIDPSLYVAGEWVVHPGDGTKMSAHNQFKVLVAQKLLMAHG